MRTLSVITILVALVFPTIAIAEIQTFTATHTYILGDHDSKDDARQRCLLEAKRKILEHAGVYIESMSEVKDFALTKDKITSFAATVMQVKDTKEEVGFRQGHMMLTLTLTAMVDLADVRKLATRQADNLVYEALTVQNDRLRRLEAQLEAMQRQIHPIPGQMPTPSPNGISAPELQALRTRADQGNATAQVVLGLLYATGNSVPQDFLQARAWVEKAVVQGDAGAQTTLGLFYYFGHSVPQDYARARQSWEQAAAQGEPLAQSNLAEMYAQGMGVSKDYSKARQWWEQAAAQGFAWAQSSLGVLYVKGLGVPQDFIQARQWFEKAAEVDARARIGLGGLYYFGQGMPQNDLHAHMWFDLAAADSTDDRQKLATDLRNIVELRMTPAQIAEAQRLASQCQARQFKGCSMGSSELN
jgi:TPR repeat protein